jgi:hypothetical protein
VGQVPDFLAMAIESGDFVEDFDSSSSSLTSTLFRAVTLIVVIAAAAGMSLFAFLAEFSGHVIPSDG